MLYVGVDQHKRYSHLTAIDAQGEVRMSCRLPNQREAFARVLSDLGEPCRSVIEAGRAWGIVCDLLEELGAEPVLANPYQVRAIAQAKVKTDQIDAHTLAQLLRTDLIPLTHVPSRETRHLKNILRQRLFLVRMRTMLKNRIHVLLDRNHVATPAFSDLFGKAGQRYLAAVELPAREGDLLRSHLALLEVLGKQIKETERWLATSLKHDNRVRLLQTVPGLGPILGALVALEIDDIRPFPTPSKLSPYAGLVPSVHASGGKVHHGPLIHHSNGHLRLAMIEAAWIALSQSPYCRDYYERIRRRKQSNVAITALARRLLEIVHAVLSENRPYEERAVRVHLARVALSKR